MDRLTRRTAALSGCLLAVFICMGLSSCKLLSELAPVKEDLSKIRDWLVVPVYYASTRKRAAGESLDYLEEKSDKPGLEFGIKNVVVPYPEFTEISPETMKRMGWKPIHLDEALPDKKKSPDVPPQNECPIPDKCISTEEIAKSFGGYRDASGSNQVVFFAHGCCATFKASLERSAKIAVCMQVPVVVFDWTSPKGFSKYLENETLAEQSYDDFYAFLNAVEKGLAPADTILIGHSMGAHFLDNALVRRSEREKLGMEVKKYAQVIFSQPDIDAKSFIRHNKALAALADKVRIYFNAEDGRLDASGTAHGGFPRLGRPQELLPKLCALENQEIINITECGTGHEIPFWTVADISHGKSVRHAGFELKQAGDHYQIMEKISKE